MKITKEVNKLLACDQLTFGSRISGKILITCLTLPFRSKPEELCIALSYHNTRIIVNKNPQEITDEILIDAVQELKAKAIETVKTEFDDFRRYNLGPVKRGDN